MALLALVLLLAASVVGVASAQPRPCSGPLPTGPAVPQPVVFENSCGSFLLGRDGQVSPRPAARLAGGGTGRKYGADLRIVRTRPGAYILRRQGAVVWRSSDLYRNDGGSIAFGPGSFAFASYRRGIFVTDLRSPERLVVRGVGLHPLAFLRDGSLLVVEWGARPSIAVVSPDGSILRRHRYLARNGYAFDERAETLSFVTPRRVLVRVDATGRHDVRPLRGLDGWLSLAGPHLSFQSEGTFTVLRRDGVVVSRWRWRESKRTVLDYGFVASRDGRTFAFRTATVREHGRVVVYLLQQGEKHARAVFRHRGGQLGCGTGASLGWHGRYLLYSSTDGPVVVVDARNGNVRSLSKLAARLPRRVPAVRPFAYWSSDLRR